MAKNINAMIRSMSKSRNTNKPMVVERNGGNGNRKKMTIQVLKSNNVIETKKMTVKEAKKEIHNVALKFNEMYIPNVCNMIITDGYEFSVTKYVKSTMSELGITMDVLKKIMETTDGRLHDVHGTTLYSNKFINVYVRDGKVMNVNFTKKMKSLVNVDEYGEDNGINALLVELVMTYGNFMNNEIAKNVANFYFKSLRVKKSGKPVDTKKGVFYLSGHARSRMKLRCVTLEDIKKSIEDGMFLDTPTGDVYVGDFCKVITVNGVIKTVFPKVNVSTEFGIEKPNNKHYKIISRVYRKESADIKKPEMIEKIRVGLGLVAK